VFAFYEFFAGGGMARLGLGPGWNCVFANDFDAQKAASYRRNFPPADELVFGDIRQIPTAQLPGEADLAWASFPCQDLSLAGARAGLDGDRCGTFWPFWKLMRGLQQEGRAPRVIALENVCGALTSNGGKDFAAICAALSGEENADPVARYVFGALVIDASKFLPQSRPRLFVVAVREDVFPAAASGLASEKPVASWHPAPLTEAVRILPDALRRRHVWWNLPDPPPRSSQLADVIEASLTESLWHGEETTAELVAMMSETNRRKLDLAQAGRGQAVGCLYKRTRPAADGNDLGGKRRQQRAEVRFDGLAGCLRTPRGGSSRQVVIIAEKGRARSRLMSAREAARLMGLPESYQLPDRYNAAYHLAGDGVAVPVVSWLARHLLEPALASGVSESKWGRSDAKSRAA
jgi:DNA (cytosine-5)-methyltransferase 1